MDKFIFIKTNCDFNRKMIIICLCLQLLFAYCCCSKVFGFNQEDENNVDNDLANNLLETTRPHFMEKISNQTVVVGREATFQCVVNNLDKYQVAWFHKDKRAILAVQDKVINNKKGRIRVTNHAQSSFYLHIREVQLDDQGEYMCQINTEPMISQSAFLHVVVPPKFIEERTSSDVEIKEGESVDLRCAAHASPPAEVRWRREDNQQIQVRSSSGTSTKKVSVVYGSYLNISKATKLDMGAYICIANNSIPAAISKRVFLGVTFPPSIYVPRTKVSAYVGQEVTLSCLAESYPEAMYYWNKTNQIITPNMSSKYELKYEISYIKNSTVPYKGEIRLKIRNLQPKDFGMYACSVNNHLGKTMGTVVLHMLESPSTPSATPAPTQRPKLPPVQVKPTRPQTPSNSKPIRPPLPDFDDEDSSLEDFDTVKPSIRRKPTSNNKQVPKSKNYDPNNQNNMSNELYPWPINQSSCSALVSSSVLIYLLALAALTVFRHF